jgi:hypothetical protein
MWLPQLEGLDSRGVFPGALLRIAQQLRAVPRGKVDLDFVCGKKWGHPAVFISHNDVPEIEIPNILVVREGETEGRGGLPGEQTDVAE